MQIGVAETKSAIAGWTKVLAFWEPEKSLKREVERSELNHSFGRHKKSTDRSWLQEEGVENVSYSHSQKVICAHQAVLRVEFR
jgi:hypothetical protein